MKTQALTVPNALSALRLLLVPVAAWMLARGGNDAVAVWLLAVAGLTDWLDGFLARKLNQVSPLGALLDPLADRVAIIAFISALCARGVVPIWLAGLIVLRDIALLLTLPALRKRGTWAVPVTFIGKAGTAVLFTAFPLALSALLRPDQAWIGPVSRVLLCAGAAVYWVAGAQYARTIRRLGANRAA